MGNQNKFLIEADGINLSAVVHLPQRTPAPVIVCCHGLFSLKESPKFVAIGDEMSKAGFCVLRFDFSGCGESPIRPGRSLIGARRSDLEAVIEFAYSQPWSEGRIGILGSSLGGFLALLAANSRPEQILAAVSWAAPFDISTIHPKVPGFEELNEKFPDGFRLGKPKDLQALSILSRTLLIHGQQDNIVHWKNAVQIYEILKDPKEMLLLRTADHQVSDEAWRETAIKASLDWFLQYLK